MEYNKYIHWPPCSVGAGRKLRRSLHPTYFTAAKYGHSPIMENKNKQKTTITAHPSQNKYSIKYKF